MKTKNKTALAGLALLAVVGAGCSSSKSSTASSGGASSSGGSGATTTVGLFGDFTGESASGNKTSNLGLEAGIYEAGLHGVKLRFVQADTQTSPTGALAAAQQLVEQDHVTAVVAVSALTFLAANYLKQHDVPVVGLAEDGGEWVTDDNMFSTFGFLDPTKASTGGGQFFKMEGATNIGVLGYGISPQSADGAKNLAISALAAGLTVSYQNENFPFGSTNVQPIAIAMKNDGVNGISSETDPNTTFSLIQALHQVGDDLKVAVVPDGYGGDLAQAGPNAVAIGQGAYFTLSFEPVEMHTAATEQFQAALAHVGVTGEPTYAEYGGYTSAALLTQALQITGPNPSAAKLISTLSGITDFNAWGLLGSHELNMSDRAASAIGVDGCGYYTKLVGSSFALVPGADPLCGTEITGQ